MTQMNDYSYIGENLKRIRDRLSEAVAFVKECMEAQPFPEFDLPLIAEASAGSAFGSMEELDD